MNRIKDYVRRNGGWRSVAIDLASTVLWVALLVYAGTMFAGCALPSAEKYRRTADDPRERDAATCRFEARSRSGVPSADGGLLGILGHSLQRRSVYRDCMRAHGWEEKTD